MQFAYINYWRTISCRKSIKVKGKIICIVLFNFYYLAHVRGQTWIWDRIKLNKTAFQTNEIGINKPIASKPSVAFFIVFMVSKIERLQIPEKLLQVYLFCAPLVQYHVGTYQKILTLIDVRLRAKTAARFEIRFQYWTPYSEEQVTFITCFVKRLRTTPRQLFDKKKRRAIRNKALECTE